jgi:cobalt-zinc-cadmium efflux system membrane fusion protein
MNRLRAARRAAVGLVLLLATAGGDRPRPAHGSPVDDSHDERGVEFTVADFERFGVRVAEAGAGTVDVAVDLPAEVRPNGERVAHVAAPYPGVAREVPKSIGESVRAGDVLAVIESDTLARYPLRSAIDGVVIDRDVVPGETVTRERTIFVVADLERVWVEISREVALRSASGLEAGGAVSYIAPVVDPETRTVSARVVLPNPDGGWRPGLFATATIVDPVAAAVVVPLDAVQSHEGRTVVFVVEDDHFDPRPVVLGRRGRSRVEIAAGLTPGERYAAAGAFRIKAELGKGAVLHSH